MKQALKYIIICCLIVLSLLSLIYSSYLPLKKAQSFIRALHNMPNIRTTTEFKENINRALLYSSPVGQEELVKFLSNDILSMIRGKQTEDVSRDIVAFIDPYLEQYPNDARFLLTRGFIFDTMWRKFNKEEYYLKAEAIYRESLRVGPRLPRVNYALFDIYRLRGDLVRTKETGERILSFWPTDNEVKETLAKVETLLKEERGK